MNIHGISLKLSFQNLENLSKSQFFDSFCSVLGHDGRIHELLVRTPPNNEKRFKNFHRSFQTVKWSLISSQGMEGGSRALLGRTFGDGRTSPWNWFKMEKKMCTVQTVAFWSQFGRSLAAFWLQKIAFFHVSSLFQIASCSKTARRSCLIFTHPKEKSPHASRSGAQACFPYRKLQ